MHFCVHFPKENVQQRCAKMHFCITFYFVKCSASHFPKENAFDAKMHLMRCKNAFLHQMHFGVHFPKENVQQRCAKMHFCITFYFVKCSASHFPLENVQHQQNVRIFVFCKAKNTAFLQTKMLESGQHKKQQTQHFCTGAIHFYKVFLFYYLSIACTFHNIKCQIYKKEKCRTSSTGSTDSIQNTKLSLIITETILKSINHRKRRRIE